METPNLSGMTRDELNAYAADHGVSDPESFANKEELIGAIEGAQGGQATDTGAGDERPEAGAVDEFGQPVAPPQEPE